MGGASGVHMWNNHTSSRFVDHQKAPPAAPQATEVQWAPITPPAKEEAKPLPAPPDQGSEVKRSSVQFSEEMRRFSAVCMPNTIERDIFSPREEGGGGVLAGEWISDGSLSEKIVVVKGGWATWPNTGQVRRRALLTEQFGESSAGAGPQSFSLSLRGRMYRARVSKMGGAILWDDGDVWVRGIGKMMSARKCEKESASAMAHYYVDNVLAPPLIEKCNRDAFL